jgi:CubicO group peptidase (beta-lactamase class C family)
LGPTQPVDESQERITLKTQFLIVISSLTLWGVTTTILRSQGQDSLSSLRTYIDFKMQRDNIPGLAACLIAGDRIVWSRGFGYQSIDEEIPTTMHSVFGTASVSKIVTAIAVMQLCERGLLDLGDPVNKYRRAPIHHPEFPDADITVAELLNHTASTSNGPSLWRCYSCDEQPLSPKEWAEAYFLPGGKYFHREGNFGPRKPGEQFLYSNAGYGLLACLVEIASGLPFDRYCTLNIFSPLKMANTSFKVEDIRKETLSMMYSYGYNMDLERDLMAPNTDCAKVSAGTYFFPLCNYTTSAVGASGMYSSVEQLAHLLIALMNGGLYQGDRILSKQNVDRILSPSVDARLLPGQFAAFGLGGYAMRLNNGALVWGHTGADPGQSSFMLFNAETKVGAIVLANRFVDIRDLIEWMFAEGVGQYSSTPLEHLGRMWKQYMKDRFQRRITISVLPDYLPGGSRLYVVGNHRYLGGWVSSGVPLTPQRDCSWATTLLFPDSTMLAFKITRGSMNTQAVTRDGKVLPNHALTVLKDTVLSIIVDDWKDQAQQ